MDLADLNLRDAALKPRMLRQSTFRAKHSVGNEHQLIGLMQLELTETWDMATVKHQVPKILNYPPKLPGPYPQ